MRGSRAVSVRQGQHLLGLCHCVCAVCIGKPEGGENRMNEKRMKIVSIRLTESLKDRIQRQADREERSVSNLIQRAMKRYLNEAENKMEE